MIELRGNTHRHGSAGPDVQPEPGLEDRLPGQGDAQRQRPAQRSRGHRQGPVRGRAAGRPPARQPVPARVLRRHAPACADRHRPVLPAAPADRGRADVGTGRHGPAADPGPPGHHDHRTGHRGPADHPRPGPGSRACGQGGGHVPRAGGGGRAVAGAAPEPAAPVHQAAGRICAFAGQPTDPGGQGTGRGSDPTSLRPPPR